MGVDVRFESFDRAATRRGGLCRVRGSTRIVVDEAAPLIEKIAVLETALCTLDLDSVFTPPLVRARIERRRVTATPARPALRKAAPRAK